MNEGGPKLYVNKPKIPKKAHQVKQQFSMEAQPPPPPPSSAYPKPPEVPRESFARRYKFLWPLLLGVNFAVGAYLFTRTKQKDVTTEDQLSQAAQSTPSAAPATTTTTVTTESTSSLPTAQSTSSLPIEQSTSSLPIAPPVRVLEPIPEQQQRELFKWMLEEKRKIKTNNPEEQKRIDEEKAVLKQFIRAKSIPTIFF